MRPRRIGAAGERGHTRSEDGWTSSSAGGGRIAPGPRLRWPDDDGIIGNVSWPYESERHAGFHWTHALIIIGAVLIAVGGLLWALT